ncbi:MAG: hypothetical protein WC823_06165 [Parcubacteria group bacterium]|jgi:hypothetical protein
MENYTPPVLEEIEEDQNIKLLRSNITAINTLLRLESKEDISHFSVLTFCDMFLTNPIMGKNLEQGKREELNERVRNLRGKVGVDWEEQDYVELGVIIGEIREIFERVV